MSKIYKFTEEGLKKHQDELEDLKTELAELKGAKTETKTSEETQPIATQISTPEEIVAETTSVPETEDMKNEQTETTLKEIDIYKLTQSEANEIWTSYLKGQCEYDLNDENINEFCTKFGFDINYAKN